MSYRVPTGEYQLEQVIKKSRFITISQVADDAQTAQDFIRQIRMRYPDANHVCWAYIAGQPGHTTLIGCSDDGEPSGTAGKPMLNVLLHNSVGDIAVTVVRYFGGVKLGTGGLARAYAAGVTALLKELPTEEKCQRQRIHLNLSYALEDATRRLLHTHGAIISETRYGQAVELYCDCPATQQAELTCSLTDLGAGRHITLHIPEKL